MIEMLLGLAPVGPGTAPDTAYFQQGIEYRIEAVLDEDAQVLRGRTRLTYTNRSPSALDSLYFHQHLNAFRPNSAWARRELEDDNRRFTDLGVDEHAFERLQRVQLDGAPVTATYPFAPDSTVFALPLERALAPGATAVVELDWLARPSTLPRRQGRQGRHYDFAQWYPRIAVYDRGGWQHHPLMPQGEFYGEYGSYDVTLDVAADQVIGATGVPVEGDPGWPVAAPAVDAEPPAAVPLGLLQGPARAGRKRVRWLAADVHHFAWSTDPEYRYEGGRAGDVAIHVLFRPGADDWGAGAAVERTTAALRWLEDVFGAYPYPQLTNVHRLESGGTEFPMLIMNGSASEGLIMHETAHQFVHGILGNNEWRDAWLDEGFATFLGSWFNEERGDSLTWRTRMSELSERERQGLTQPVATPAASFVDFRTYTTMSYSKGAVVLYMLRELIGEPAFRRGLRLYYERHRLRHVTEADLREAMEAASGQPLGWFFEQWLHTTDQLDYAIGDVDQRANGAGWVTRIEVFRLGRAWMPVVLRAGDVTRRLGLDERRQVVDLRTPDRPTAIVLDPDHQLFDIERANNVWTSDPGLPSPLRLDAVRPERDRLGELFGQSEQNRVQGLGPLGRVGREAAEDQRVERGRDLRVVRPGSGR